MTPNQRILTINGGSSSIKFAVFAADGALGRLVSGAVEGIGQATATLKVRDGSGGTVTSGGVAAPDHAAAVRVLADWMDTWAEMGLVAGVGHRIVHGGGIYCTPQPIAPKMLADLRQISPFDPLHMPEEILLAEAMQLRFPHAPHIACFDTGFHAAMPSVAQLVPVPRQYAALGARRYGFHGLSYTFLMQELARLGGVDVVPGRIILAHLGNGASLAAVKDGKPVDTSMGFTPASGVMMGSRAGDLDPGLISWLMRTQNIGAEALDQIVNFQSGLLGISQTSSDMRVLLAAQAQDVRAAEAVALFCYQIKKSIGAYAAALGGIDQLVFAGGIGEKAPEVRSRICEGLAFLGIEIDAQRNAENSLLISSSGAKVKVHVIPTDEEVVIATAVVRHLRQTK